MPVKPARRVTDIQLCCKKYGLGCGAYVVEFPGRRSPDLVGWPGSGGLVEGRGRDGLSKGLPAVDLAHLDPARSEEGPEQLRHGLGAGQPGLGRG